VCPLRSSILQITTYASYNVDTLFIYTSLASRGIYAESLLAADFNNDGIPDIAILNNCTDSNCSTGGSVTIFLGSGNGTFNFVNSILLGQLPNSGWPVNVTAGDFNNDGQIDLAVLASLPGYFSQVL
jgi:hypothetical protein